VVTEPTVVIAANLRHPVVVSGNVNYYQLITSTGEYAAANPPDIYDKNGAPTTLSAELSRGSVVRVSVADNGMMIAVQLIDVRYANPFERLMLLGRLLVDGYDQIPGRGRNRVFSLCWSIGGLYHRSQFHR
jgi:hypothetical protein